MTHSLDFDVPNAMADKFEYQAIGITKRYGGVRALNNVSISLPKGECVALVGDNGAGKSTLVQIMSGSLRPDSGSLILDQHEVEFHSPLAARHAGVETVYQDLALADDLNAPANIYLGRELTWGPGLLAVPRRRAMAAGAKSFLERTGVVIPDPRNPVARMSGGQRQGLAIARAVGWNARVILMDEPTAALGLRETRKVEEIIRSLREREITILLISHNLQQVFTLADRIVVLRRGSVAGVRPKDDTTPEEIVGLITGLIAG
jgi:ABC-type sugar transport system ATPase subunit